MGHYLLHFFGFGCDTQRSVGVKAVVAPVRKAKLISLIASQVCNTDYPDSKSVTKADFLVVYVHIELTVVVEDQNHALSLMIFTYLEHAISKYSRY